MTMILLSLLVIVTFVLSEWVASKVESEEKELEKAGVIVTVEHEANLHMHCDECFYFKKVEYVEEEDLFLCEGCK
ncbi:hypothetical protein [Metabacillus idriensis]|uniref:hypothetical protein n=1 Tax=Metabacillus idriensis TaxID=324768 RepID=UPI00174CF97E|nr:hypothetical protein [Metabacillus idriensis]